MGQLHQPFQEIGNDNTGQNRSQHLSHGEDDGEADQEKDGQEYRLWIGKAFAIPLN